MWLELLLTLSSGMSIMGKSMKYFVIMAIGLTLTACQSTMPNDVILAGYNDPKEEVLQSGEAESVSSGAQTEVSTSTISNEQDFDAVANTQTVESDAERIAANRANYIVIDARALPQRGDNGPNVVEYAIRTNNLVGVQLYDRFGTSLKIFSFGGCGKYSSTDAAQQAFLLSGGPEIDAFGIDPDGDGFACEWDPLPFRAAVKTE